MNLITMPPWLKLLVLGLYKGIASGRSCDSRMNPECHLVNRHQPYQNQIGREGRKEGRWKSVAMQFEIKYMYVGRGGERMMKEGEGEKGREVCNIIHCSL